MLVLSNSSVKRIAPVFGERSYNALYVHLILFLLQQPEPLLLPMRVERISPQPYKSCLPTCFYVYFICVFCPVSTVLQIYLMVPDGNVLITFSASYAITVKPSLLSELSADPCNKRINRRVLYKQSQRLTPSIPINSSIAFSTGTAYSSPPKSHCSCCISNSLISGSLKYFL